MYMIPSTHEMTVLEVSELESVLKWRRRLAAWYPALSRLREMIQIYERIMRRERRTIDLVIP
jgi:hypothetical protein